ncbi:MAG TPA: tetratricopeptide repeat protein [Vicinamibacterales bacterium]|nr:tetratricopeptide repeat protein [Vicinamibacterales bacterium]
MTARNRASLLAVVACLAGACASHRSPTLAERFVHQGTPALELPADLGKGAEQVAEPVVSTATPPAVPPAEREPAPVIPVAETDDQTLAQALAELKTEPKAVTNRRVAERYLSLHIYDKAVEHFTAALKLDSKDVAASEGLARAWRDWGSPEMALGQAYRALALARNSAQIENTIGTILFALGLNDEAEARFKRAAVLAPAAPHIRANLCYVSTIRGDGVAARAQCDIALALDPGSVIARNNLALLNAAEGDFAAAERAFTTAARNPLEARYNLGIVLLSAGRFADAAAMFAEACRGDLPGVEACEKARYARLRAARADERIR